MVECRQLTGVFNSCLMKPLLERLGSNRKREVLSISMHPQATTNTHILYYVYLCVCEAL